ncbi:MAG: hypothetical protein ACI8S6_002000, partial [Myxococcota bacterium]
GLSADLSGEDIRDIEWSCVRMTGADLREVNLSGAQLSFVYLRGAART